MDDISVRFEELGVNSSSPETGASTSKNLSSAFVETPAPTRRRTVPEEEADDEKDDVTEEQTGRKNPERGARFEGKYGK